MNRRQSSGPLKRYDRPNDPACHDWPGGFTWIAHPDETMHRASHALVVGASGALATDTAAESTGSRPSDTDASGSVWVVEPIDFDGLDDRLAAHGPVAGVVVLAALHGRDADAVATRHEVPVYLPETLGGLAPRFDAPVETFTGTLPGTDLRAIPVLDGVPWSEVVLHDPETGTLVATEILVTSDRARGRGERLSVGPYARLQPPSEVLADRHVERVLVGHGPPLLEDAGVALDAALANSLRGIPGYLLKDLWFMLRAGYVALRD